MRWVSIFVGIFVVGLLCTEMISAQPLQVQPVGQRPPALAPFAPDDPIPQVMVEAHAQPKTPRQAAETFLFHLSKGVFVPGIVSIRGAEANGYDLAWALMGHDRPPLPEFRERWKGTAAMKVVQLMPAEGNRFFVELERLERCGDHWAASFYSGFLETIQTPDGWRIKSLDIQPEDLLGINVAGHQGWQHDEAMVAKWVLSRPPDESWVTRDLRYEGRTATVTLWHPSRRETAIVRLIRTMEGSWGLLSKTVKP